MLDSWTNCLQDGGQIDVIYTDFEKAFDKVPHKRLLSKLQSYVIATELSGYNGFSCLDGSKCELTLFIFLHQY